MSIVGSYTGLYYQTGSDTSSVRSIRVGRGLSRPLAIPPNGELVLFRKIPPPPDAPEGTPPIRVPVLSAELEGDSPGYIVVARPLEPKEADTRFSSVVVPLPDDFGAGTCLIANLSSFPNVAASFHDDIYKIAAGTTQLVSIRSGHNMVRTAVRVSDDWKLAGSDTWRLNETLRGYFLILPYMEDPDYPPPLDPPPVLTRIHFQKAPSP
ncbi:hypothetical protein [Puniceicoccus vermicola]|uniref:Uncharacterized protein n=2 Tax=Puniceicoccus vermicola TaxID=388746 RepID=A0A7X1AZP9_9BACT|nr:hypothetical protein [Puniceicoccus vermicola]